MCARTRFWISLRLDGEISSLEAALLDAHLRRCDDCLGFAQGAESTTKKLRPSSLPAGA